MDALLEADDLRLAAGARTLVDGLSLRVAAGEIWAVLGPNGSGKTTLLHALAGLQAPLRGRVRVGGSALDALAPDEAARRRGLMPQAVHDAFSASALEVVLLGRHPHLARWAWEDAADRALALAALAAVDLAALAARDVTTLSGGERQRVALAALLTQDPPLLLLDEPLAHLDLHHQLVVLRHLETLARTRGKAVVLALHDLGLARRFATHALVLGGPAPVQGPVDAAMSEATLGAAFGHRLRRRVVDAQVVFLAE